jgi:hypothetical protein
MIGFLRRLTIGMGLLLLTNRCLAVPKAPVSLNTCQNAVKVATATFVKNKVTAIGTCLQAVSTEVIKKDAATASGAAANCVRQFRAIHDTRGAGKSLTEKLTAAIVKKCEPGRLNVTHTLGDILGSGAGVPQPIDAQDINAWCAQFGGDGSIDTLQEWIDCLVASQECAVQAAISTQYPRALAWLDEVKQAMNNVSSPARDMTQVSDAVAGLDGLRAAIAGPSAGMTPQFQCGNSGVPAQSLRTGQTTCYNAGGAVIACAGSGQDGELQKGVARQYVDNGDGTITDMKTGLTWEKLSRDGSIHEYSTFYTWTNAFTKITSLNTASFAGHTDWRLPTVNELQTVAHYGAVDPAVDAAFNTSCAASCTVLTCSCTQSDAYWSSTTYEDDPPYAWFVNFFDGFVYGLLKPNGRYVRAVRGGS